MLSLDITPSHPVYSIAFMQSAYVDMPPLTITGMVSAYLTFLMISQLAAPISYLFYSLIRPCTTSIAAPALSITFANSTVSFSEYKQRILHVTGTFRFWCKAVTMDLISSVFSSRKDPYLPLLAIPCGHPRLISTASQSFSTYFAAFTSISGSFPQN